VSWKLDQPNGKQISIMSETSAESAWVKGACPGALYERACLIFQQEGDVSQLITLLESVLASITDKRDPKRLRATYMMGKAQLSRHRGDALAYLKEFIVLGSPVFGAENDEVLSALQLYAEACMKTEARSGGGLGNAERALSLLIKTLEEKLGPDDPALLRPLELCSRLMRDLCFRRPSFAPKVRLKELQVTERGLRIAAQSFGPHHIEYGRWLISLADLHLSGQENTSHLAVPLLKEALPIMSQQGESFEVSHCAHSLSQALAQCGKFEEASRMLSIYSLS
jgi:hypothetical protein